MDKARVINSLGETVDVVTAATFDPATLRPGEQTQCPECTLAVHHKKGPTPHFASRAMRGHALSCTASIRDENASPDLKIQRAVAQRRPLVYRLDIPALSEGQPTGTKGSSLHRALAAQFGTQAKPMIIDVGNASELSLYRSKLRQAEYQEPDQVALVRNIIPERVAYRGRLLEPEAVTVNSSPQKIIKCLFEILGRTSRAKKRGGFEHQLFLPYLFVMNFALSDEMPEGDVAGYRLSPDVAFSRWAGPTVEVCTRDNPIYPHRSRRHVFPFQSVRFVVNSADEDINRNFLAASGRMPSRILATLDEASVRHAIYSRLGQKSPQGALEIALNLHHRDQMVMPGFLGTRREREARERRPRRP